MCVCDQAEYADNLADAVDRLLLLQELNFLHFKNVSGRAGIL